MSKKSHHILDSLMENIESNVSGFIAGNQVKEYFQESCKVSDLSRERLLEIISSNSYTFETTEAGTVLVYYNSKIPADVVEQQKISLENIRIAQIELIEQLKEAKKMQVNLHNMMRDFKQRNQ